MKKFNDKTRKKIVEAIRSGDYLETAAAYVGVPSRTVRKWVARGSTEELKRQDGYYNIGEEPYHEFWLEVMRARAEAEHELVSAVRGAIKDDWRAAIALLERQHPRRWGRQINLTVETELNSVLDRLERDLPPETFRQVLNVIAQEDEGDEQERIRIVH